MSHCVCKTTPKNYPHSKPHPHSRTQNIYPHQNRTRTREPHPRPHQNRTRTSGSAFNLLQTRCFFHKKMVIFRKSWLKSPIWRLWRYYLWPNVIHRYLGHVKMVWDAPETYLSTYLGRNIENHGRFAQNLEATTLKIHFRRKSKGKIHFLM